jgi:hypothetical protein
VWKKLYAVRRRYVLLAGFLLGVLVTASAFLGFPGAIESLGRSLLPGSVGRAETTVQTDINGVQSGVQKLDSRIRSDTSAINNVISGLPSADKKNQ